MLVLFLFICNDNDRLTLPKNHPGDYWSEWMKIWEKSMTPMKHDVMNVETERLQAGHIIQGYHKPNPKTPDIIFDGERLRQFSTSNEQMYGKQSSDFPQQNHAEKTGDCFYQGIGSFFFLFTVKSMEEFIVK